ncbi:MAG: lipid II:glycine glycyltransferase FemX [Patescibacteria group bacterium]|jgi:peptidoglycan pentaglycine glycine transferase (the first glycine)|nr:peptidoglycan bridge formation glycyltransferase FemA/FemB family protein [Patescibacteria group bacterium]
MKVVNLEKKDFSRFLDQYIQANQPFDFAAGPSFLQSLRWQEIQSKNNFKTFFHGLEFQGELVAIFLAIAHPLFRNYSYYYLPRGPIFLKKDLDVNKLSRALINYGKENQIVFFRVEPSIDLGSSFLKVFDIQPAQTSFLDLSLSEDDLLKQMASKTRYNIRLADKRGVKVSELGPESLDQFWSLISLTSERDSFAIHSREYYKNLMEASEMIKVFAAHYQNRILAMGIFSFYHDTVSYLHGASSNNFRNLMAPHLLQWELIKKARRESYRYYDFYGISDKKWPGVTRFKRGFGGYEHNFPGTFDLRVYPHYYRLYTIFRFLNKIRRRK